MEHAFQTCAHCGTLNFQGRKLCSYCKFRLPDHSDATAARQHYRHWNTVIVGVVLVAIGLLLAAAFIIDPY